MKARAFPLATACLLAIPSQAAGQATDLERESLAGLDGLHVFVEDLRQAAQEGGLKQDALRTYLEMRLRQARIPVLSKDEWLASERRPYLYLTVGALPVTAGGGWAYRLGLEVRQRACIEGGLEGQTGLLSRNGGCSPFRTWGVVLLAITSESLPDQVRGTLAGLMDELVNDYLAMNP